MKHILLCILLSGILLSCREDFYYTQSYEIDDQLWHVDDVKTFEFDVKDTSQQFMWFIDVRHAADFEFANFYVFPKRYAPNGKIYTDTLNIPLADPSGRWYGKGLGDMLDNRILWKKDVKFPHTGKYRFELEQGSREETLEGIVNIGFSMYEYK